MQLSDILNETGGLRSIARELGIAEDDAARAASALSPAVLGGLRRQAGNHPQGLQGLGGLLNQFGGSGMLDAVLASSPTDTTPGNNVLGEIFGSKEVSRAVANNAAAQTGQDPSLLKKMLPMLAMLVAGYMAKQRSTTASVSTLSGGGTSGVIGSLLGGTQSLDSPDDELDEFLKMGGQRNPLDEIMGRLGR